jgi:hypothetical protein
MDQVEVKVIGPKTSEGTLAGLLDRIMPEIFHPDLAGEKELLAGNAALADGCSDLRLVFIHLSRVDVAVAHG